MSGCMFSLTSIALAQLITDIGNKLAHKIFLICKHIPMNLMRLRNEVDQVRVFFDELFFINHHIPDELYDTVKEKLKDIYKAQNYSFTDNRIVNILYMNLEIALDILYKIKVSKYQVKIGLHKIITDFDDNINNLSSVRQLVVKNFPSETTTHVVEHYIQLALPHMQKIDYIELKSCASDRIIEAIGNHCPNLKYISIKGCITLPSEIYFISSECLEYLKNCINLEAIVIDNTSAITPNALLSLILSLPNLIMFKIDARIMGLILNECSILPEHVQATIKLKLTNVKCSHLYNLNCLTQFCPYLVSVHIVCDYLQGIDLQALSGLQHLRQIDITRGDLTTLHFHDLLHSVGKNFSRIRLNQVRQINYSSLIFIGQRCPNLKSFEFVRCYFCELESNFRANYNIFPSLINLCLKSTEMNADYMRFVMERCPKVTCLYIEDTNSMLTDDTIAEILSKNPMSHLVELELCYNLRITITGIRHFLENCEKLEMVTGLDTCTNIGLYEISALYEFLNENNRHVFFE